MLFASCLSSERYCSSELRLLSDQPLKRLSFCSCALWNDTRLSYSGRINSHGEFAWPGFTLRARFHGATSATLKAYTEGRNGARFYVTVLAGNTGIVSDPFGGLGTLGRDSSFCTIHRRGPLRKRAKYRSKKGQLPPVRFSEYDVFL